jgi:hypothetical protein
MKWVEKNYISVLEKKGSAEWRKSIPLNMIDRIVLQKADCFHNVFIGFTNDDFEILEYDTPQDAAEAYAEIYKVWEEWKERW